MTFPILGGNGAVAGYSIDNSLRFEDGDTAYLNKSSSGSTGAGKTFTLSLWVKRGELGREQYLVHARSADSQGNFARLEFNSGDFIRFRGYSTTYLATNRAYRDVSAWYHLVLAVDTDTSGDGNSVRLYVNGVEETDFATDTHPSTDEDLILGSNRNHFIATSNYAGGTGALYNGYMAEIHLVDGQQLSPTDFGEYDEDSGIWKPKQYTGSYGTNGFYLDFENSGSLGTDQSGNGNNFTPNNLASTDQTTDTPTNNFATFNSIDNPHTSPTYSEGNTKLVSQSSTYTYDVANFGLTTGKWYWEIKCTTSPNDDYFLVGISSTQPTATTHELGNFAHDWGLYGAGGVNSLRNNDAFSSYGNAITNGDIIGVALDLDNNRLYFSINGTFQNSSAPASGTNPINITAPSSTPRGVYLPAVGYFDGSNSGTFEANFGNPSFSISSGNSDGNGYGNFEYAPPSGYLALCTQNLATALSPTIDDGSAYFHTQLYTGNGSADRDITNDANAGDFQPDWLWIKTRSLSGNNHHLFNSSVGMPNHLSSDLAGLEQTATNKATAFNTDGFRVQTHSSVNQSSATYVAWQWKANGGTTSSNTDGDVTSTVQVNSTAGFSITTFTGNSSPPLAVGHGLGVAPQVVIAKHRNVATHWRMWHQGLSGAGYYLILDSNNAEANSEPIFSGVPTSTTVGFLSDFANTSHNIIFYSFAEIEGYSKFGSYEGNAVADGTFVYTGFRPAWIMIKRYSGSGHDWIIIDTKRFTSNVIEDYLKANSTDAEIDTFSIDEDILSNGFKLRGTSTNINGGGSSYIYMAFAENPFVTSSGVPVTAR